MKRAAPLALVLLATLVVWGRVAWFDFLSWDDGLNVAQNPRLLPPTRSSVADFWRAPFAGLYVPVAYSYWSALARLAWLPSAVNPAAGTLDPRWFHAGNVLLHLGCVALIYALARRWGASPSASAWGAALFAWHPLHVESVAWVTEAKGLLAGWFSLAALWCADHLRHPRNRFTGTLWALAGTLAFVLALLSKPQAASLPVVAAVLWWAQRWAGWGGAARAPENTAPQPEGTTPRALPGSARGSRWKWSVLAGWVALALIVTAMTRAAQPPRVSSSFSSRLATAADALGFYVAKTVWPWPLGPDYARSPTVAATDHWQFALWLVAVVVVGMVTARRGGVPWWPAAAVFFAALLPTLGLVPFSYQRFSTVADRYAYFALAGPAWWLALWLSTGPGPRLARAAQAVILLWAPLCAWQTSCWAHDESLFRQALVAAPTSSLAHNGLGNLLAARGQWDDARSHYQRAAEGQPPSTAAWVNLAALETRTNRPEAAIAALERAIALEPTYLKAHYRRAELLLATGRDDEAVLAYRRLCEQAPGELPARLALAAALMRAGRLVESIAEARAVVAAAPDWSEAKALLDELERVRRPEPGRNDPLLPRPPR